MQIQLNIRKGYLSLFLSIFLLLKCVQSSRKKRIDVDINAITSKLKTPYYYIADKINTLSKEIEENKEIKNYSFADMINDMNSINKKLESNNIENSHDFVLENKMFVQEMLLIYKEIIRKIINCFMVSLEKLSSNPLYYEINENEEMPANINQIIKIVEEITNKTELFDIIHIQKQHYNGIYKLFNSICFTKMNHIQTNLNKIKFQGIYDEEKYKEFKIKFETYTDTNLNDIKRFFTFKLENIFKITIKSYIESKWISFTDFFKGVDLSDWHLNDRETNCKKDDKYLLTLPIELINNDKIEKIGNIKKIKELRDKLARGTFIGVTMFSAILINPLAEALGAIGILIGSFAGLAAGITLFGIFTILFVIFGLAEN